MVAAGGRRLLGMALAVLAVALLGLPASCGPRSEEPVAPPPSAAESLDAVITEFVSAALASQPGRAVRLGRHEHDGALPDWSRSGLEERAAMLDGFRVRASDLALTPSESLRRRQLLTVIERQLFWLREANWPSRSFSYYAEELDPTPYLARPYAPHAERLAAYARFAASLPTAVGQLSESLDQPLAAVHVAFTVEALRDLAELLRREPGERFRSVDDSELRSRFERANAEAVAAVAAAATRFAARAESSPEEGFALGDDLLSRMLRVVTGGLGLDLGDLERAAWQEVERSEALLAAACAALDAASPSECREALGPDASWPERAALALDAERRLADLGRAVAALGLNGAPTESGVRVLFASPLAFRPAVSVELPGPFDASFPPVLRLAMPDRVPAGDVVDSVEVRGVREVRGLLALAGATWPGAHLKQLRVAGGGDLLASAFPDPLLEKGWSRYAVELVAQRGLDPGDPVHQAVAAHETTLAAIRLAATLGLHRGSADLAATELLFAERGLLGTESARAEAWRCAREPERLLEGLGALAIERVRDEWLAMRGLRGRQAEQAFHDQLLPAAGLPLAVVRERLVPGVEGSPF